MQQEFNLDPILDFNMSEPEAKAYKIALLWMDLSKKIFPDYRHRGLPPKGDPRKGILFQHCFKLQKETCGLIDDYKLYIKAQLAVLKAIDINGSHPNISPACLSGDKAWIRWKLWQRKFNTPSQKTAVVVIPLNEIIEELTRTKKFLDNYQEENANLRAKTINRWITLGKVSPFYALLSSWINKHVKITTDLDRYKPSITPEVQKIFKEIFHE